MDRVDAYVFDAVRTARGKGRSGGALSALAPIDLQKPLIEALLERNALPGSAVADLILGCVTQVGEQGANVAKVAALHAGLPPQVPGMTVNRYCTSSLDACNVAALRAACGLPGLVLAGGVESMSRVPLMSDEASFYAAPEAGRGAVFVPMGLAADLVATLEGFDREACDAYAVRSQQRAAVAQREGRFARSIVPVLDPERGARVDRDESVRGSVTAEKLGAFEVSFAALAPAFQSTFEAAFALPGPLQHVHHPGNSPGIVDGASLVLIGSAAAGEARGLAPRARIRALANTSGDPLLALTGGIDAAEQALEQAGMRRADVDLVEFNEAFASVSLKFLRDTGWEDDRVNVNGGAIALGHAMGATGATLVGTLIDELERRDLSTGMVAVSGAAGIGTATILERC
jgi:acetyl-CoA C-acetyltransferase